MDAHMEKYKYKQINFIEHSGRFLHAMDFRSHTDDITKSAFFSNPPLSQLDTTRMASLKVTQG